MAGLSRRRMKVLRHSQVPLLVVKTKSPLCPLEVVAEQVDEERRLGDGAGGGCGLGWAQPSGVRALVQGADVGVDDEQATVEVEVVAV